MLFKGHEATFLIISCGFTFKIISISIVVFQKCTQNTVLGLFFQKRIAE